MLRLNRKMRFRHANLKTKNKNVFDHIGSGEEYFCTRCGATLNVQTGFNPSLDTWVCRECGQFLFGNVAEGEEHPRVMWYCDQCGDLLNKQEGFTDTGSTWKCEKCQYINPLDTIVEFKNPQW